MAMVPVHSTVGKYATHSRHTAIEMLSGKPGSHWQGLPSGALSSHPNSGAITQMVQNHLLKAYREPCTICTLWLEVTMSTHSSFNIQAIWYHVDGDIYPLPWFHAFSFHKTRRQSVNLTSANNVCRKSHYLLVIRNTFDSFDFHAD